MKGLSIRIVGTKDKELGYFVYDYDTDYINAMSRAVFILDKFLNWEKYDLPEEEQLRVIKIAEKYSFIALEDLDKIKKEYLDQDFNTDYDDGKRYFFDRQSYFNWTEKMEDLNPITPAEQINLKVELNFCGGICDIDSIDRYFSEYAMMKDLGIAGYRMEKPFEFAYDLEEIPLDKLLEIEKSLLALLNKNKAGCEEILINYQNKKWFHFSTEFYYSDEPSTRWN